MSKSLITKRSERVSGAVISSRSSSLSTEFVKTLECIESSEPRLFVGRLSLGFRSTSYSASTAGSFRFSPSGTIGVARGTGCRGSNESLHQLIPASWRARPSRHSWWQNTQLGTRSAVPRHSEINNNLARKICRDLGIPEPERF